MRKKLSLLFFIALIPMLFASLSLGADVISIGINAPLTGDIPKVGEGTKYAAEM